MQTVLGLVKAYYPSGNFTNTSSSARECTNDLSMFHWLRFQSILEGLSCHTSTILSQHLELLVGIIKRDIPSRKPPALGPVSMGTKDSADSNSGRDGTLATGAAESGKCIRPFKTLGSFCTVGLMGTYSTLYNTLDRKNRMLKVGNTSATSCKSLTQEKC